MLGPHTQYQAVRCGNDPQRLWLNEAPVCTQLDTHRIIHAGIMEARPPLAITRMQQSGSFFMATIAGHGEVMVDGLWSRIRADEGCLLPPHYPNALRACTEEPWTFAWVRYLEPKSLLPIAAANRPVIASCPPTGLASAVRGLIAASANADNPAILAYWVDLVHAYVQQFAGPSQTDERLWTAWDTVSRQLGGTWSLESIARQAYMSPENFRRLCQKHLGRSPMKHLAFLRIQRSMKLLSESDDKIGAVAATVGYHSVSAFSKAFRRWTGQQPSDLRASSLKQE